MLLGKEVKNTVVKQISDVCRLLLLHCVSKKTSQLWSGI